MHVGSDAEGLLWQTLKVEVQPLGLRGSGRDVVIARLEMGIASRRTCVRKDTGQLSTGSSLVLPINLWNLGKDSRRHGKLL